MNKNKDYKELARIIANRSICQVKVGAIIYDNYGIFSWGWNHSGESGLGEHAEVNAIKRANPNRLMGSSILIYSIRKNRIITSRPCDNCWKRVIKVGIKDYHFYQKGIWFE